MKRALTVPLIVLLLASCAGGADVSGDRRIVDDTQIAFTINPARVAVGKAVRLVLRVTNSGGRSKVLKFPSGQLYDFWITDGSKEVWRWSDDQAFSQALEQRTLPTQDTLSFTESWNATGRGELIAHGLLRAERFEQELTGKVVVGG